MKCCMCEKSSPSLKPSACLVKHGDRAHRICKECWWDPDTGFAREGASHECPGCKKGLSLLSANLIKKSYDVIDLTRDD